MLYSWTLWRRKQLEFQAFRRPDIEHEVIVGYIDTIREQLFRQLCNHVALVEDILSTSVGWWYPARVIEKDP